MTGNGHNDIEFRFADFEHAVFCLESAVHDIRCHLSGNHCPSPLMKKHILLRHLLINLECLLDSTCDSTTPKYCTNVRLSVYVSVSLCACVCVCVCVCVFVCA